jgi:hypothetical protein
MKKPSVMHFYLEPGLKESAEAGTHNFLGKIADLGRAAGMELRYSGNRPEERARSKPSAEWAVMHMDPSPHARAVTLRRAYYYPFWSIEQTDQRAEFDVALSDFNAGDLPKKDAEKFVARWRRKWFEGWTAETQGHVYVPLQGRLLEQRSFQSCTPIEMVRSVLRFDPDRPVITTLHPKENYRDDELAALGALQAKHPRLSVQTGGIEKLLPGCDYVVTQNSAAGFAGYFWAKPLVLFGRVDFHHIAAKTWETDANTAIRTASSLSPDYDAYLYWFLQRMAINAGRPEADARIAARLRSFGWPV